MENTFLLAQIFGWIWLILELITFQFKSRKIILALLMVWSIFWAVHFYFLQELVSVLILIWTAIRLFIAFILDKNWKIFEFSKYFFVISIFIITFIFYKNYVDIFALFAWVTWVIASFQKEDKSLRIISMISTFFWLIISILIFTPVSIIVSTTFLLSNIIWYFRFYPVKIKLWKN